MLSAFELERQARIEENKRRMSEMGINTLASKLDAVAAPVPNPQVRLPNNAHCPVFAPFSETRRWRTNRAAPLGARARLPSVPRAMREGIDLERVTRRFRRLSRTNDAIRTGTRAQCARDPPRGFPPDPRRNAFVCLCEEKSVAT
jgi:hypothetical protein